MTCCYRHFRALSQHRDLMRRGWHTTQRERGGGRPLLNMTRIHRHKLMLCDRIAHDFIGWKLCSRCTGSAQHESALLVGVAQVGALIPGVSRSGSTLTAALALGFQRDEAARFSFLLGLPAIALAGLKELWELHKAHSMRTAGPSSRLASWSRRSRHSSPFGA